MLIRSVVCRDQKKVWGNWPLIHYSIYIYITLYTLTFKMSSKLKKDWGPEEDWQGFDPRVNR
jgi:hypothetical protein